MTLFRLTHSNSSAFDMAGETLSNMRVMFEQLLEQVQRDHKDLWYANEGLEGPNPTGIQVLQALEDKAQHVMFAIKARVDLLQAMAAALGLTSDVEWASLMPPYDFVWNEDGSLGAAVLKK